MKEKEDWGNDVRPYDEFEDVRPRHNGRDEWDEDDDEDDCSDPSLDPAFSSWQDFYNYMYR